MAISSATASISILRKDTFEGALQASKPGVQCVGIRRCRNVRFQIKAGAAESPQETKEVGGVEFEGENSTSVEASKVPYSIISTLNVEKILRGIPITDVDHYARLGIPRGCLYDQVNVGYKNKYEELMKQELEEEELANKMDLLKESYSILSSQEERRLYDWSLLRTGTPDRFAWPFESDITQADVMQGTPPPGEPEDFGPTRLVGYFFVGWLVLAVVSSIAFNL
ncbi:NAD(P)H-quinone oxidoreductase subunit U, chloroplastic-like [Papaver somniferum]|uniref:NAD(P)H-quinone oxidoreductase subunit U, chloroplastic-like n=1 Tax=Papaver somniferum TaxID=3469 RepID=UPI000E7040F4|nr:NAD(P)H-quinone oxidoreductase subunit U, chloroplastic-like [Papaver somniferum]